nr:MAG TPA: Protein of unknown function (DUF2829) [Caudoviricetes sp.]
MKFEDALKAMREGKKVIQSELRDPIFIETNYLEKGINRIVFEYSKGCVRPYEITEYDILHADWEIVDEHI